jgi:uncharacterized protein YydD (DUF2326 family)
MKQWSDEKTWWLDLLKFGITFTLGAIITILVVNRFEEDRAKQWSLTLIDDQLRLTALEDFRKNTFKYHEAALDAYIDLRDHYKGLTKTSSMIRYEQEAYEDYQIAVEELERSFVDVPELKGQIANLNAFNDQRHQIYNKLKDEMKKNQKYGPETPATMRPMFDELRDKFKQIRGAIIRDVGTHVLTHASKAPDVK